MLLRFLAFFMRLARWLFRQEIGLLVAAALIAIALWLFGAVADEVLEGEADPIDRRILLALRNPADPSRPIGPGWLVVAAEEITALGSTTVLAIMTLVTCAYLWLRGSGRSALFVLVAIAGGTLVSTLLKAIFARPRPDVVPHLTHFGQASFPSGHAMLSTAAYLTLGALLAAIQQRRRERAYVISVALALAAMVGLTRVYLGVHYPTDVAAGWTLGIAWAVLCWGIARWFGLRAKAKADAAAKDARTGESDGNDAAPPTPSHPPHDPAIRG